MEGIAPVSRRWYNAARLLQIVHGPADISALQRARCGATEPATHRGRVTAKLRNVGGARNMLIADMTRLDRGATAKDTVSLARSCVSQSPQNAAMVARVVHVPELRA
jgi:hypothetical protein